MLKKILLSLLLLSSFQLAFSQTASELFRDYSQKRKATYISLPRAMMSMATSKLSDNNLQAVLQDVKSAKVLKLDNSKKSVRKKFIKQVKQLPKYGYEEFTRVSGNSDMLVMVKHSASYISEIAMAYNNGATCMGVLITGNINPEDLEAIIQMAE
ncbi:MAG: DUF4252 domain-containing protein [Prevotella sp.]|nr:DUF4252 domain-containing protein [Prevotella sp.]